MTVDTKALRDLHAAHTECTAHAPSRGLAYPMANALLKSMPALLDEVEVLRAEVVACKRMMRRQRDDFEQAANEEDPTRAVSNFKEGTICPRCHTSYHVDIDGTCLGCQRLTEDPTRWCNACGSITEEGCDCGPIAGNE